MRANRYLHIAVIGATLLFLVLWQTAAAGPPEKPGNPGLPGCLAKVSELNNIVANQQETIDQQEARIEELEDMLENFAPVPQTGQTTSYATGDDGDLQMGVQWPDPRFTDNTNGTVIDNLTGLMWLKDGDCFGARTWQGALDVVTDFNTTPLTYNCSDYTANYDDWRLPNLRELLSLIDFGNNNPALPSGHLFTGVQSSAYWSSTTDASFADGGWRVHMLDGRMDDRNKSGDRYVWPVRGGND